MVYGAREIAASFRTVRGNTLKIAEEIPEDKYDFQPSPDVRSVRQMLVHIAMSPSLTLHIHQNKIVDYKTMDFMQLFAPIAEAEKKPWSKADVVALLKSEGEKFASFVDGLSDAFLAESVTMMPGQTPATKTRFELLLSPKEHEMHHRAQLMLIERMIGIVPHLTRHFQERMAQRQAQAGAQR